ncbi:serine hydrolase domain-containing protein [Chelatococcus reniformis]|uniref:Serine hydrolase n=1 Tax=Chelatococcus reniformis TaxID=1494448 RepID=A0A916URN3_9HYPH|nr:serine hydrolase domain-containing protein [Chelatococcus reniformis]GGC83614.1 serine hydrolase [Chelatococcus reniformis]
MLPTTKPEEVGFSAERLARLTAALRAEVDRGRLPGAVTLIARYGKIAHFEAIGVRDPASGTPMRTDSIFRIYSMTKPIVSTAVMMLVEQGRLLLSDPVSKYIPAFAKTKVGIERDGEIELIDPLRPMTVQDLLRHTSGLSYEFLAGPALAKLYADAKIYRRSWSNAEHAEALATLPLIHQPGTHWDYSRSTDVLGRIVEVVTGRALGAFLQDDIFAPLGMVDTAFSVPESAHDRVAEAFPRDPDTNDPVRLIDVRTPAELESGGGGLVSTALDYARFLQMLQNGGALDTVRLLSRKTVGFMASNHLGPGVKISSDLLPEGYGFGLGFAVRLDEGIAAVPGSVGQYFWGGIAGTTFWIDPEEECFALLMVQAPGQRDELRQLYRNMVHAAFGD